MKTASGICKKIKERCNNIERQNLFANINEKRSLIFYSEMKQEWAREEYTVCCIKGTREVGWLGLRLVSGS
jgi:hypothetical protein